MLWGAHGRYNALFNSIGNGLDGEHGFGHWDSCYYLLDQKRLQRESATFAKLLFDDFELYVAMRNASVPASRHRQLNRDLKAVCEKVNAQEPHLSDGRRLRFKMRAQGTRREGVAVLMRTPP